MLGVAKLRVSRVFCKGLASPDNTNIIMYNIIAIINYRRYTVLTHSKLSAHGWSAALHAAVSPKPHKPWGQHAHASGTRPSGQTSRSWTGHRIPAHPSSGHCGGASMTVPRPPSTLPATVNATARVNACQKQNNDFDTRRRSFIITIF